MATYRHAWWDPFGHLRQMQRELERLVGHSLLGQAIGGGEYPAVNVFNSSDDMIVQCEVPGLSKDDLELSITAETLAIKGTKKPSADPEKVRFHRRERASGDFSRTIVLPDKVDGDKVEAHMEAGVLTIRLPKSEAAKPRQIDVK